MSSSLPLDFPPCKPVIHYKLLLDATGNWKNVCSMLGDRFVPSRHPLIYDCRLKVSSYYSKTRFMIIYPASHFKKNSARNRPFDQLIATIFTVDWDSSTVTVVMRAGVASCWLNWRVVRKELFWLSFCQATERPIRTMIMLNTMPYISS